jgi:hypothetical protein
MHAMHGVVQSFSEGLVLAVLEDSHRLYNCARCGAQVRICRRCDRGNRYCAGPCAAIRRQESLRRAGNRYQRRYRGACRHAVRQRAWRRRQEQEVTHQGSPGAPLPVTVAISTPTATMPFHHAHSRRLEERTSASKLRHLAISNDASAQRPALFCHFCQRALTPFARLGPLSGGP